MYDISLPNSASSGISNESMNFKTFLWGLNINLYPFDFKNFSFNNNIKEENYKKIYSKKQRAELDMIRGCFIYDKKLSNFDIKNVINISLFKYSLNVHFSHVKFSPFSSYFTTSITCFVTRRASFLFFDNILLFPWHYATKFMFNHCGLPCFTLFKYFYFWRKHRKFHWFHRRTW